MIVDLVDVYESGRPFSFAFILEGCQNPVRTNSLLLNGLSEPISGQHSGIVATNRHVAEVMQGL